MMDWEYTKEMLKYQKELDSLIDKNGKCSCSKEDKKSYGWFTHWEWDFDFELWEPYAHYCEKCKKQITGSFKDYENNSEVKEKVASDIDIEDIGF